MSTANEIFEKELKRRSITFSPPDKEGLYKVHNGEIEITVNLANIARNFERDKDPESIIRFVDQVMRTGKEPLPPAEKAKPFIYFSAEPNDYDFGDAIRDKISDEVSKVLVLTEADEGKVTWLTPKMLSDWKISENEAKNIASQNMNKLLDGKKLEVRETAGMKLGMIPITTEFKASIIFASNFKKFVTTELIWPVIAVIPCRDFIYVLSEKDTDLLNRLGGVVQKEFRESGYPITTEVFKISDEGIKAIGAFPK